MRGFLRVEGEGFEIELEKGGICSHRGRGV